MESLEWLPADEPLSAVGLIVAKNRTTVEHLLGLDDSRLAGLRGSYCDDVMILLGSESFLPWFSESAIYLGRMKSAPKLLIPTTLTPNLPIDWVQRSIKRQFGDGDFVINPHKQEVYNISDALTVSQTKLRKLIDETS